MKIKKPYYIKWIDAHSFGGGWQTVEEKNEELKKCQFIMETVGFLFKETKTHYVFAQSISDGSLASKDLYDDGIMIVKSNILKIKEIK